MNRKLPCLLVRQPYASLIAYGKKRWELRSYDTKRRGRILIAASRGRPIETTDETLNRAATSFPRGVLLASAQLTESTLVSGLELREKSNFPVKTRIGDIEFWTADAPVGEPLQDIRTVSPTLQCYAWHLDDVKPLTSAVPLDAKPCSPWTVVDADIDPRQGNLASSSGHFFRQLKLSGI